MDATTERLGTAAIVALGVVVAGALVGRGATRFRQADKFVNVKGVSEREVKADLALWPIQFSSADNDLALAHGRLERNTARIRAFLAGQDIDTAATQLQTLRVMDRDANPYRGPGEGGVRFIISQTLMVRSTDPDRVFAASQRVGDLVQAGVALSSGPEFGPGGPTFLFTKLNDIKPAMIAEATGRAREAAEQFARDAGTRLGSIRQASQGVFVILPRDQAPGVDEGGQLYKTVRVVTTVEYYLR